MEKLKFASVCGIYCETECSIYRAYSSHDEAMRRQLALLLLKDVNRWEEIQCDGCKGDQKMCWCKNCSVKSCAYERNHEFCIECEKYPCISLKLLQRQNEVMKKNDTISVN